MRLPAVVVRVAIAAVVAAVVNTGISVAGPASDVAAPAAPTTRTANAVTGSSDADVAGRLRSAANAARAKAGLEPLFARTGYVAAAERIATALVESNAVPATDAPVSYYGGVASKATYETAVAGAVAEVVSSAGEVLAYPLHTDGGWTAVSRVRSDGKVAYGVALVVGWPAPPVTRNTGCSADGYCWANRGLNPHLPWTRNTVTWHLSTAGLPAGGETLVKNAIARLDAVRGFGADVEYGGLVSATRPSAAHRFLVVWGSGCTTANALACTTNGMQGTYDFVYQNLVVVMASRYAANPDPAAWTGTLTHELAHGMGLDHYDTPYAGRDQLMRWAAGPNTVQAGDANGLRRIAPPGRVRVAVRAVRNGAAYDLVVRTANDGLGGIRAIRTECRDASGVWRTVARVTGTFDGLSTARTVGSAPAGATCRALARSKASLVTSAPTTAA